MTGEELEPYERLVLALADGVLFNTAAIDAGLRYPDALREATAFGWPDRNAIRQAAQDIRNEHSREEIPMARTTPPSRREPIPIEPDVEDAMSAGAALIREARASVALDRDETHEVGTMTLAEALDVIAGFDRVDDGGDLPPRVAEAYRVRNASPMAGHGLDAAVALDPPVTLSSGETVTHGMVWRAAGVTDEDIDDDVPQASTAAIDRELMEDTGAILQLFDRLERVAPPVLNDEQRARAHALRVAADITKGIGDGPGVMDLLELADYITTGTVPVASLRLREASS